MGNKLFGLGLAVVVFVVSLGIAGFLAFAVLLGASDGGRGSPDPIELAPAVLVGILGLFAGILIGRRRWRA